MAITERSFVEKIQEAFKADHGLRGAVVFKHAETGTAGIPDLSISVLGSTAWIEVKYLRKGKKLKDIVKELQVITCHQLSTTCNGRAWIVVYDQQPKRITIWHPRALAGHLWPKITAEPAGWQPQPSVATSNIPLWKMVNAYGGVYFDGHPHALIARLVREAACQ